MQQTIKACNIGSAKSLFLGSVALTPNGWQTAQRSLTTKWTMLSLTEDRKLFTLCEPDSWTAILKALNELGIKSTGQLAFLAPQVVVDTGFGTLQLIGSLGLPNGVPVNIVEDGHNLRQLMGTIKEYPFIPMHTPGLADEPGMFGSQPFMASPVSFMDKPSLYFGMRSETTSPVVLMGDYSLLSEDILQVLSSSAATKLHVNDVHTVLELYNYGSRFTQQACNHNLDDYTSILKLAHRLFGELELAEWLKR